MMDVESGNKVLALVGLRLRGFKDCQDACDTINDEDGDKVISPIPDDGDVTELVLAALQTRIVPSTAIRSDP